MADFGLQGIPSNPDEPDWVANAHRVLDRLPAVFSTVWISDHLQIHGKPTQGEAWTQLTWLASAFPRLRFGHLVLCQSYRSPGLLGAMAATLQRLTRGRFILGLGAGWLEEEYRAFNFEFPGGGTRVAQLGEAIQLIKTLWTNSPASYDGRWYRLDAAQCLAPEPQIPIMVGTNGPKALKVAARFADWWNWDGPWEPTYRRPFELLKAACEEIGRPFDEITLTAGLPISMPDDPATFEPSYEHDFYPGQVFRIVGPTAADVIREIETLVDVGVSHLQLAFDTPHELDRFVAEVVPNVRLSTKP
jgi:alkanesulfonate monooxygenase SsuD/methylene tetrahydromethanopterin reductase-like flavin-dependent oxidoreductase (luciferase family)